MPTPSFGPWTTSLDAGSRLELSAFWRGRMARLMTMTVRVTDSPRRRIVKLAPLMIAAALFPMLHPPAELAEALGVPAEAPTRDIRTTNDRASDVLVPMEPRKGASVQVALNETATADAEPDDPQARDRQTALRDAIAHLSGLQRDDGSWSREDADSFPIGRTSLGTLALTRAGVKPSDLRLRRAGEYLRRQQPGTTYEIALQTVAFCALDPKRDADLIQRNATWLEEGQSQAGPGRGGWSYGKNGPQGAGDNSNSDFAIWGLEAAARTGAKVRRETWEAALDYWLRSQSADGGWPYSPVGGAKSTGSMTTAGVATVATCLAHLTSSERQPTKKERAALDRGLRWMKENYAVRHNPQAGTGQWLLYYAVMFRRAVDVTNTERVGDHDWRGEFSEFFLSQQNAVTGSWRGGGIESDSVIGTSLAVLALTGTDPRTAGK